MLRHRQSKRRERTQREQKSHNTHDPPALKAARTSAGGMLATISQIQARAVVRALKTAMATIAQIKKLPMVAAVTASKRGMSEMRGSNSVSAAVNSEMKP